MDAIRTTFRNLLADQGAATAIEYGLIAALIVLAMVSAISQLGGGALGMWTGLNDAVQNT